MDVFEAIKKRKSIREYKADAVPEKSLEKILEAGRLAPSAHNSQSWKFIVVKESETRKKLAEAANDQSFLAQAPLIIAAVALDPDHEMPCGVPSYAVDLAIALDHMALEATEEGLGSCWIGAFQQEKAKEILGVPRAFKIVALLCVGFPAEPGREKSRKSADEVVCFEKFLP